MLIPFQTESDADADIKIIGNFRGSKLKDKVIVPHYYTYVTFNPVTQQFIPEKAGCMCWAFPTGRAKDGEYYCKHQKELIETTTKYPEELQ
jgi:hypothetical protein